jgi:hypothetical protein
MANSPRSRMAMYVSSITCRGSALVAEIVGMDPTGGERPHRIPQVTCPSVVRCIVARIIPDRDREAIVAAFENVEAEKNFRKI